MPDRYSSLENFANGAPPSPPGAPGAPSVGTPAVRGREHHGRLKIAQAQLKAHGFDPGHAPNGRMTQGTQKAIAAFQRKRGLTPTGTLDARTQSTLAKPPHTAGRTVGSRRMNGGPVLVRRQGMSANKAASGGTHQRAGQGAGRMQNRSGANPSTSATGITPGPRSNQQGRTELMQGQAEYESAGKRVPAIFQSSGTVAAGATASIVVQPQIQFRGENLVIDSVTAAFFSIVDLKVGVPSQNAGGTGNIPCTIYAPNQNGALDYEMDLADPGTQITMTVINNDTVAHTFLGTLWGHEIMKVSQ